VRIPKYALALILAADILLAATSPFTGKWKMNQKESKYTKGDAPKDENMAISDQGDQLQVVITGTDDSGQPIAVSYVIPVSGGAGQMQPGGTYNGVSTKRVSDNTRDLNYTKDGKPVIAEHMVVASDGNTMTVTIKGVDSDGKPVEGVLVFDKQ
jgi:protocatechuate 3,4-dioxygenase beta subunit